jgi:hypothetical protein
VSQSAISPQPISKLKRQWQAFRRLPKGRRFQIRHREHQRANAGKSRLKRALPLALVPLLLAAGIVLMFIPGPAILFFFLAGAVLASHSLRVARLLDRAEVKLRSGAKRARAWWRRSSLLEKLPILFAALLVVAGAGFGALQLFVLDR